MVDTRRNLQPALRVSARINAVRRRQALYAVDQPLRHGNTLMDRWQVGVPALGRYELTVDQMYL
jgi:hypothetical protein